MSDPREMQLQQAKELDELSLALVRPAVCAVKNHPVISGMYVFGILIFAFATGLALSDSQIEEFSAEMSAVDLHALDEARHRMLQAQHAHYASKGWFSCDNVCMRKRAAKERAEAEYQQMLSEKNGQISEAKKKVGIFSEIGVQETRDLFWERIGQGKDFAKRSTFYDALFIGMRTMGRDESLMSYLLNILFQMLFNIAIGLVGAVVGFTWTLYSLIQQYQESLLTAAAFFFIAVLAAVAFAATWFIGLYGAAAGTVYIGAKVMANNLRIEGGPNHQRPQQRIHARAHYD